MQRSSGVKCKRPNSLKNKYYINENSLSINGEKIKLLKLPYVDVKGEETYERKIRSETDSSEVNIIPIFDKTLMNVKTTTSKRGRVYSIKTPCFKSKEVFNDKLKDIYETVEIEKLRRLLGQLTPKTKTILVRESVQKNNVGGINVDKIYKEFFEQHYDFLEQLAVKYNKN